VPANEAAAQRKRLKQLWKADGYTTSAKFAKALGISPALIAGVTLDWLYDGDEAGLTVALRKRLRE